MAHLEPLADESFDLIVHPVSNVFAPELQPVWNEAFRVLRPGGVLLTGFTNPDLYLFDVEHGKATGELRVKYSLPYSDIESLTDAERAKYTDNDEPLEFSHTFEEQLGGQLAAGFVLTAFFEDTWEPGDDDVLIGRYMATFFATRAVKPG